MATAPVRSVAVSVDRIRPGLFVRALDRPWTETPFLFQGFRIVGDADVEILRSYCSHVYIDLGRSEPAAVEHVLDGGGRKPLRPEELGGGPSDSAPAAVEEAPRATRREARDPPLFQARTHPDRELFRSRVQLAARQRSAVSRAVIDALERIRKDQIVDVPGAERAVSRMARLIADDPTASLWLTRMQAHGDYTSSHAVNCCVLALAFGQHLGFEGRTLDHLGLGALLMDVGRITLPRGLLSKQRRLSATEWAFVKRHVANGARLLGRGSIPADALAVVRMHHERIRGYGYPAGLSGERIPRGALIGGLVDSYDAMLRRRPYRDAYQPDAALKTLYEQADATFGRELVESFIRYLGAYPVGTVVELDNRAVGIVVGNRPGAGLWPTVLLVRNADRKPYQKRLLLNLAAANERDAQVPARSVRRTLTEREAGVPVGKVVATEFGLAQGW